MGTDRKQLSVLGARTEHPADLSGLEELGAITHETDPDSVSSDVAIWIVLPGEEPAGLEELAARVPTIVVANENRMIDMVDRGCRGFLSWSASGEEIRAAAMTVLDGGAVVPPAMLGTLLRHLVQRRRAAEARSSLLDDLTDREREVYELAAQGARKDEIGEKLFISSATARTHLQRVYRKLGVHSQTELMSFDGGGMTTDEIGEQT